MVWMDQITLLKWFGYFNTLQNLFFVVILLKKREELFLMDKKDINDYPTW